jgi:hypothetical protein
MNDKIHISILSLMIFIHNDNVKNCDVAQLLKTIYLCKFWLPLGVLFF